MKKKFINIFSSKTWLTILSGICLVFIGLSLFTDILNNPLQTATSKIITPLQKGVNGIGLWLNEKSELLNSIEELKKENEDLQHQLDELYNEHQMNLQDQVELEQLRELYELDNNYAQFTKTGANVIARNSDNWYSTFTIDKGSKHGIKMNMNVLSDTGLVGIVVEVSEEYSVVRSIIDDSSKISAMLLKSSDLCTVNGDLKLLDDGYIRFEHLSADVNIKNGDMIITSHISEKYHQGLLIGYVKDIKTDSNNLSKSGYIVPAVDFKHIQKVLVIMDEKVDLSK